MEPAGWLPRCGRRSPATCWWRATTRSCSSATASFGRRPTQVLPGEPLALHAAVAAAVETVYAGLEIDAAVASELAHHWYEARDGRQALPALLRAGRAAERMFAFGNAFAHYHLALSLWPSATETSKD